ncbi:MAG: Asp-tRNA(Asn)/Glu-tRNA(Gln) amidotransferase subunit GatB [Opitutales bacterium]|jgi:aspartyl-tRNA(Asn)/glutamyl-tRNA(Gln) amidotransferase subunit B|tara:strand:- start:430 stop:1899 length:1470 start_codon:yes stop_codon:yes gene_type:complete
MKYEAVIGLEVHVQLDTESKMFTRVGTGFGKPPNTLTDAVVLGLPGALPVMNREAIEKSIKVGLLLGCKIAKVCKWDRKNYFYPDMPKNYQISQFDQPICEGGEVEIEMPGESPAVMGLHRIVQLTRIHLEEDVGKLTHYESDSLVDYNRAGSPLLEIVSEPDLFSPDEVFAYLTSLRNSLVSAGISSCDMEKGQLRCDANISIRPEGTKTLGTKVELKNLNTISGVRNGVEYEIRRQTKVLNEGGEIFQETRRWNPEQKYTTSMRSKEMAHDYRYFPDPDLMPVEIADDWVAKIRTQLPEKPFDKQRRYQAEMNLPYSSTSALCGDRLLCEFFETSAALTKVPAKVANWVVNDLLRELGQMNSKEDERSDSSLERCKVTPSMLAELVNLIEEAVISNNVAKEIFPEMFSSGKTAKELIAEKGLEMKSDGDEIEAHCAQAISSDPDAADKFRGGKEGAINALKGAVMKATRGQANPKVVDETLRRLLAQ